MGKGKALLPAAHGSVCDFDVGGANPIAQQVRPITPKSLESLAEMIKG